MKFFNKQSIKLWARYAVVGLVISCAMLFFIDQIYLAEGAFHIRQSASPWNIPDIPQDAQWIGFSSDNLNYLYVQNGELYIKNSKDGSLVKTIVDQNPVVGARPMDDRNIVLYFTVNKNVTYTEQVKEEAKEPEFDPEDEIGEPLPPPEPVIRNVTRTVDIVEILTYNIDTGESISQKKIETSHFERVGQVEFSSLTNVIYVKIGTKNKAQKDTIYRINIMKTVSTYTSADIIEKMALLLGEDSLYYQSKGVIYFQKKQIKWLKDRKPHLLACSKDTAFLYCEDEPNKIYTYQGDQQTGEMTLPEGPPLSAYANSGKVYLVYNGYIVEVTGDPNKKIQFKDTGAQFLAVSNGMLYIQKDGVIKSQWIK